MDLPGSSDGTLFSFRETEGTKNVSDNITGVKADADKSAAAAEDVKHASETLETQSQQLGNQVTQFLGNIRAA